MRYFLFFLLLSVGIGGLACSPYFPYNYFYRGEFGNETEPQFAAELRLIAVEQKEALAPYRLLRPGTGSTLDAEKADFLRLVPSGDVEAYLRLAGAVRNGANADWRSVPGTAGVVASVPAGLGACAQPEAGRTCQRADGVDYAGGTAGAVSGPYRVGVLHAGKSRRRQRRSRSAEAVA